uniref:Putative secreted protein n=1 Tax=Anopheles darlingi TaxID=43151 RepID=A0A2M4DRL9_ANODA
MFLLFFCFSTAAHVSVPSFHHWLADGSHHVFACFRALGLMRPSRSPVVVRAQIQSISTARTILTKGFGF